MTSWAELFAPVAAQGRDIREGQAILGQAVIDCIDKGGSLIGQAGTGTGKSFATLIPIIHAVHKAKAKDKLYKGVVSTETITLQQQLFLKDLPFLHSLYGNFTYRKLMGRTNYVCFDSAKVQAKGNSSIDSMLQKLKTRADQLGDGEYGDVQRVLKKEITKEEFAMLAGSSQFCSDNQCKPEKCWSTLARNRAMSADIVVVNHALLATDIEMKVSAGGGAFSDGLLGQIDTLVVDEGHSLEPVLVSQWTKEITDWELSNMISNVDTGIDTALSYTQGASVAGEVGFALEGVQDVLNNIQKFFYRLAEKEKQKWSDYSGALSMKYLSGSDSPALLALMREYEEDNPKRLQKAEVALEKAIKYLDHSAEVCREQKGTGLRFINKGLRASKDLLESVRIIGKALETKDGIVNQWGTFGCSIDGWTRQRDGSPGMTLRLVPLDVSARAKAIWAEVRSCVLLSATLTDLTDGSFKYARQCVAFPDGPEVDVNSPFSLSTQQLIYITKADREPADLGVYSFEELVDLLLVTKGRALVLFTARKELDWAAQKLLQMRATGHFPYKVLVQERDSDKDKLAKQFKEDTHSVLIATKSFFTGFDAPGETLSLVAMCKFPLPRYSVECKQQMAHWRTRGFPKWYERKALTDMEQAFGRLIRSDGCRGILALMDFRVMDVNQRVYQTAKLGVNSVGSPITQDLNAVGTFLSN